MNREHIVLNYKNIKRTQRRLIPIDRYVSTKQLIFIYEDIDQSNLFTEDSKAIALSDLREVLRNRNNFKETSKFQAFYAFA